MASELLELKNGRLKVNFHVGQWKAWQSERRFVTVLAGTQGGKTSFGPVWLHREIQRCGPGDYMIVAPTYPLLNKKALPEFKRLFVNYFKLGRYVGPPAMEFRVSRAGQKKLFGAYGNDYETTIFFGHASDPQSLESATAKAVWIDEAGQNRFKLDSWEAIQRRLSLNEGRALITTTPYNLGWLKQQIWDPWQAGDTDIDVIRFDSIENPRFSRREFERAKRKLPGWKFRLFYRAMFTRPAGLIYDCFDDELHKVPRFAIPDDWGRYLGLDYGGVNTAGIFYAKDPKSGKFYAYREYKAGGRTAADHVKHLLAGEPMIPICVGGSRSEGQWRREFRAGGLPVKPPPISSVEVGIDRVYGLHKAGKIIVFDDLKGYLDEKMSYARKVDENGDPLEDIEDKSSFHYMDGERYIMAWCQHPRKEGKSYSG